MTNIIQVQNRLKSVPDETLISEIQRPTGQAPSFLVLNELNRRKNDRAEYARRQEEGPQTTVAEDIVKPTTPPAGIGALRPPQAAMGPQAMAPRAAGPQMAMASPMPTPRQATMPGQGVMPGQGAMPGQPIRMNRGGPLSFKGGLPTYQQERVVNKDEIFGGVNESLDSLSSRLSKYDPLATEYTTQDLVQALNSGPNVVGGGVSSPEMDALDAREFALQNRLGRATTTPIDLSPFQKYYTDELAAVKEGRSDARGRGLLTAGLGILDRASQYGASQKGIGFLAGAQPGVSQYEKALEGLATRGTAAQRGISELGVRGADLGLRRQTAERDTILKEIDNINARRRLLNDERRTGIAQQTQDFGEQKWAEQFPLEERKVKAIEADVNTKKAQFISKWREGKFTKRNKWQAQSNVQSILKSNWDKLQKDIKNLSKEEQKKKIEESSVKEMKEKVANPISGEDEFFTYYETNDPDFLRNAFLAASPADQARIKSAHESQQLRLSSEIRLQSKALQDLQTLQEGQDPQLRYLDQDPKMGRKAIELIIKYNIKKHKALSQTGDRGDKARAEFIKKFEDPAFRLQIKKMIQQQTKTGKNILAMKEEIGMLKSLKRQGLGGGVKFRKVEPE